MPELIFFLNCTPLKNALVIVICYYVTQKTTPLFVNLQYITIICTRIHETHVGFHTLLLLLFFRYG